MEPVKWEEVVYRLLNLCLGLTAFSFTLFAVQSGDAIMYLALARDFVFSGDWKFTDPYLYSLNTPSLIWIHEYLSFALFSWFYNFLGWSGLIWLKSLVWTAVFVITLRSKPREMNVSWVWIALWLLAVLAGSFRFIERSSMFSDLFCVSLYALLLNRERLSRGFTIGLTFMFLLWAQLHPAFPFGLALLFLWSAYHTLKSRTIKPWYNLWLLAPVVAVCIHPDGVNALLYPIEFAFKEASIFKKYNFEWMPAYSKLFRFAPETIAFWILSLVGFYLFAVERAWRTLRGVFFLIAFVMAVQAVRFVPWASFAMLIAVKPWARFRFLPTRPKPWQAAVVAALLILLAIKNIMFGYTASSGERIAKWGLDPKFFPVKTVEFLKQNRIAGELYNTHDLGSYLIWQQALPIFHHGFVTDMGFYENDVMGVFRGQQKFLELARKYNWTMLLVEKHGPYRYFYQILAPLPEWRVVAEDESSYLIYRMPN
jgi:hypothetical protein